MGDKPVATALELVLLAHVDLDIPSTKPTNFDKTIGGTLQPEARQLLKVATAQRTLMIQGLTNDNAIVDPRNVVAAVANYFPSVNRIQTSMEDSADVEIKLNNPLNFSWTSAFGKSKKEFKFSVIVGELCMVHVVRAIGLYNSSKLHALFNEHKTPNYQEASAALRAAVGILDYVAIQLLPRWINPPEKRPVELYKEVIQVVSGIMLCTAQRITIALAVGKKSAHSVLAKLYLGAADKYNATLRLLHTIDGSIVSQLLPVFSEELELMPGLMRTLAFKHMAQAAHDAGDWGAALGYAAEARRLTTTLNSCDAFKSVKAEIASVVKEIAAMNHEYNEENSHVYFATPKSLHDLPIPEGSFLTKPTEFILPLAINVKFGQVKKLKDEESSKRSSKSRRKSSSSKSKDVTEGVKRLSLKCPKGVDPTVFKNLPLEMQEEVVLQYKDK